jgi:hypothetical protein
VRLRRVLRVRMRLRRARGRKRKALRVVVRLGRAYRRKGRALRVGIKLRRELRVRAQVVRGLRRQVGLRRARKSNTTPLAIERGLFQILASSSRVISAGNGIRE